MINEEIKTQVLDALGKKTMHAQTQARELRNKLHTLEGVFKEACKAYVVQDEPHVGVGGLLDAYLFWGKGCFWERSTKGRKDSWKEEQHV
jgi:hypothetical protein